MERLVRVAIALQRAGSTGLSTARLVEIADFGADAKDGATALGRDFKHMRNSGWRIDNVAPLGSEGHFVMTTVDARMRVRLSPDQQAALRRAAVMANREDLGDRLGLETTDRDALLAGTEVSASAPTGLGSVSAALTGRRLLTFRYKGVERAAHPVSLQSKGGAWYLRAQEEGSDVVKHFVLSRMSDVVAGPYKSARSVQEPRHPSLHPMHWQVDPPIDVHLRAGQEFVPDVLRWLGQPRRVGEPDARGRVELILSVTNRRALRSRLYELGTRVEVLGPELVREEILAELAEMAGVA